MYNILAILYEFSVEFFPFLILLLLIRRGGKYSQTPPIGAYILPTLFALYIMAVFYVTDPGTVYDVFDLNTSQILNSVNLIPFSNQISVLGYALNVAMFIPFGFLVPLIWWEMRKPWHTVLVGAGLSLLIELSQLLSIRATDVDDLILNTLGAGVGWVGYCLWRKISHSRFQQRLPAVKELPAYILVIFLGRFFLYNRMGLINLVYGY